MSILCFYNANRLSSSLAVNFDNESTVHAPLVVSFQEFSDRLKERYPVRFLVIV
jgi:hypothetical protein